MYIRLFCSSPTCTFYFQHDKEEARKKRIHDALQENEKLLARKKADRERIRVEDENFGARYRKESEDYIVSEKKKAEKIRVDNLRYQNDLKAQMRIEKHDTDKGISEKELKLNRGTTYIINYKFRFISSPWIVFRCFQETARGSHDGKESWSTASNRYH